jgi:hypothetical protein
MSQNGSSFMTLADDHDENSNEEKKASNNGVDGVTATSTTNDEGAGAWTVQSSTKTRRLAPQFTLSKQDLGADSPRNRAATQETVLSTKKKGWV